MRLLLQMESTSTHTWQHDLNNLGNCDFSAAFPQDFSYHVISAGKICHSKIWSILAKASAKGGTRHSQRLSCFQPILDAERFTLMHILLRRNDNGTPRPRRWPPAGYLGHIPPREVEEQRGVPLRFLTGLKWSDARKKEWRENGEDKSKTRKEI